MQKKPSFFERLTGSVHVEDIDSELEELGDGEDADSSKEIWTEETEGELTVDVHQNENEVIITTMVAGVDPSDIEINATRDTINIKGFRENKYDVRDEDYFHRELYWGSFSRTIMLPCEIETEETIAKAEHGLLTIILPKIDKHKQTKIKVKSN